MNTNEPISRSASAPPALGDMLDDIVPVLGTVFVAGPPVLVAWAGTVVLALMLAGPFALLVTLIVVLVAAAALVTLAGAILAIPVRSARRTRRPAPPRRGRTARSGRWSIPRSGSGRWRRRPAPARPDTRRRRVGQPAGVRLPTLREHPRPRKKLTMPTGRLMKNAHRQLRCSTTSAPSGRPGGPGDGANGAPDGHGHGDSVGGRSAARGPAMPARGSRRPRLRASPRRSGARRSAPGRTASSRS